MYEFVTNLHIHTRYSDGTGTHAEVAQAAIDAGLDCIIFTDHNVLVRGVDGYLRKSGRKLLVLVGEEIHDQARQPQKSHLLVFGVEREMATYADHPQQLIDRSGHAGGLTFLAHPVDPAMPLFHEDDISWENWEARGYTGLELWNSLSELKQMAPDWLSAIRYGLMPETLAHGPHPQALQRWESLLAEGKRVVAIGGSDAHALKVKLGPFTRTIFPYPFHFHAINTHVLTPEPLTWLNHQQDSKRIYQALQQGRCFIGYDLPAPTRGFRFTAQTRKGVMNMGDEGEIQEAVTLQVRLPLPAEFQLFQDGRVIKTWHNTQIGAFITNKPGVYRVEAYISYMGKRRGWIFSNPIYLRPAGTDNNQKTGQQWSQTTLPVF